MPISKRWPKVSAIISTYNRPAMLREALESALNQTYDDFEVWVVDDGSNTALPVCEDMMEAFKDREIKLNCLNLPENSGYQAVPKNHAIQLCDGSYIAYLDDDNLWDRNHLETLVHEIEKGGCEMVFSLPRYVGKLHGREEGGREAEFVQPSVQALVGMSTNPVLGFIDTSAILHSKAALRMRFGGSVWDESLRRFGDWDLIRRCHMTGVRIRGIDKVTFTYRWHGENLQLVRPVDESPSQMKRGEHPDLAWDGMESVMV